ncbi:hypothetical protein CDAR_286121 [Caerostris darwini]|uniref:Uncharacterized protein n=1 Tax=Caerostris darwini TaxID=1538125 RepID=A0AAV4N2I9_9ARAC|nr:hypothetical protein CDAR_286121 [Caerostris darwini]
MEILNTCNRQISTTYYFPGCCLFCVYVWVVSLSWVGRYQENPLDASVCAGAYGALGFLRSLRSSSVRLSGLGSSSRGSETGEVLGLGLLGAGDPPHIVTFRTQTLDRLLHSFHYLW